MHVLPSESECLVGQQTIANAYPFLLAAHALVQACLNLQTQFVKPYVTPSGNDSNYSEHPGRETRSFFHDVLSPVVVDSKIQFAAASSSMEQWLITKCMIPIW